MHMQQQSTRLLGQPTTPVWIKFVLPGLGAPCATDAVNWLKGVRMQNGVESVDTGAGT